MKGDQYDAHETRSDVRLVDLLIVLLRQWRVVAAAVGGSVMLALVGVILLPPFYQAESVLVPAADDNNAGFLIPTDLLPPGLLSKAGGSAADERLIETILKSKALPDSVVSFVAGSDMEVPSRKELREIVHERATIKKRDDGAIQVRVRAPDARIAAAVAAAYPNVINRLFADLQTQAALARQSFLESQLTEVGEQLAESERRMVQFQQTADAPEVAGQARQTLEVAAALQRQILEKEVALGQLRRAATPDHPDVRAATGEINALRSQLRRLMRGQGQEGVLVPLGQSAGLQVAFVRVSREYLKNEQVYKSLTAALAEARIASRNTLPVVTVLDAPTLPAARHPKPFLLWVVLAVLLGLFVGTIVAFVVEYGRRLRHQPAGEQLGAAWDDMKSGIRLPRRATAATSSSAR
jgi:hypothetical protein